ncbi:MAG: hypothetical protein Q9227_004911 [Pyrenula ochraceoflavens]
MTANSGTIAVPKKEELGVFLDTFGTDIISVLVGPTKQEYRVHAKLICSVSPFFDRAIHGKFLESRTSTVELPEEDHEIFGLLLQRLYRGSLPDQLVTVAEAADGHNTYTSMALDYYCIADALLFPDSFKLEVLNDYLQLLFKVDVLPNPGPYKDWLSEFNEPDPLLQYIVDMAAYQYHFSSDSNDKWLEEWFNEVSNSAKKLFVRSSQFVVKNAMDLRRAGRMVSLQSVLGLQNFTTIAKVPRYQIGFLSKKDKSQSNDQGNQQAEGEHSAGNKRKRSSSASSTESA